MKNPTRAAIVTAAIVVGVLATPGLASAGNCAIPSIGLCGVINNEGDIPLTIRLNYGDPSSARVLQPGESSTKYGPDADQFLVPDGKDAWMTGATILPAHFEDGWIKVRDHVIDYGISVVPE